MKAAKVGGLARRLAASAAAEAEKARLGRVKVCKRNIFTAFLNS